MIAPVVHLNGTSRQELEGQLEQALHALRAAEKALREAAPHARDYYPHCDPNAFKEAQHNHFKRLDRLQSVRTELELIWEEVGRCQPSPRLGEMATDYQQLLKKHGLPVLDQTVLEARYSARTSDWHVRTKDGWFYCRVQDVKLENRKWVSSAYGPS